MFLAYSTTSNDQSTKNTVLSVFKERLKNGFIRSEIMDSTFQTFTPVSYYFRKTKNNKKVNFYLTFYIYMFLGWIQLFLFVTGFA